MFFYKFLMLDRMELNMFLLRHGTGIHMDMSFVGQPSISGD